MIAFRQNIPEAAAPPLPTRSYFAIAAWAFLASGLVGLVGALRLVLPEDWVAHLPFARLRPLHTFYALYAMIMGLAGMVEALLPPRAASPRWARLQIWLLAAFGLAGGAGIAAGWMSGREYLGWAPALTPLLLGALFILMGRVARGREELAKAAPEGFWLLALGLIFTFVGLLESQLYLFPAVGGDLVRNLSVQWHGLDTVIAGLNAGIYGGAIALTSRRSKPLRTRWLFAFAGFSLLFTFSHHHYLSPQPSFLKWLALAASLVAGLSFFRHAWALLRSSAHQAPAAERPIGPLLASAEVWTIVAMGTGVLFALPNLNLILHGTHLVLMHAMGSMIGINFILIVLAGFLVTGYSERACPHTLRWGLRTLNLGLVGLWVVLGAAGWIKGSMRLDHTYADYQAAIQPWLYGFPVFGLLVLVGLFLLCFELIGACESAPVAMAQTSSEQPSGRESAAAIPASEKARAGTVSPDLDSAQAPKKT